MPSGLPIASSALILARGGKSISHQRVSCRSRPEHRRRPHVQAEHQLPGGAKGHRGAAEARGAVIGPRGWVIRSPTKEQAASDRKKESGARSFVRDRSRCFHSMRRRNPMLTMTRVTFGLALVAAVTSIAGAQTVRVSVAPTSKLWLDRK